MRHYLVQACIFVCIGLSVIAINPVYAQDAQKYKDCMEECKADNPNTDKENLCDCKCNGGIVLNTDIPFIGQCIRKKASSNGEATTLGNAFPKLMGGLIRVVMSSVVIVGLLAVLIGGFMVAAEGAAGTKQKGMELIKLAIGGLVLVGLSGIILNLINPSFFKTATLLVPITTLF